MDDSAAPAARRRSRRIITRDEVLDAAVAIVDAEGLGALSMRRLADATGVAPMTIYGVVDNKDELVARLGAHVLRELPPPLGDDRTWRDRLTHEMTSLRQLIRRHDGLLELLAVDTDAVPVLDDLRERLVRILHDGGFDDAVAVEGLGSLIALTVGFSVGSRSRHVTLHGGSYERLRTLPAEDFPHLTRLAGDYGAHWSDRAFAFGLGAVLDAIEAAR